MEVLLVKLKTACSVSNPAHNYSVPPSAVSAKTSDSKSYSKNKLFWIVS